MSAVKPDFSTKYLKFLIFHWTFLTIRQNTDVSSSFDFFVKLDFFVDHRGPQKYSSANPSKALEGSRRHSEALGGTRRHSEGLRGPPSASECLRSVPVRSGPVRSAPLRSAPVCLPQRAESARWCRQPDPDPVPVRAGPARNDPGIGSQSRTGPVTQPHLACSSRRTRTQPGVLLQA